jgi:5-methylcytosine-specific restriction endonuclease McrA
MSRLSARVVRNKLIKKYGPVCQICIRWKRTGRVTIIDLTVDNGPLSYSVDHIIARADGGSNGLKNKQPAHRICNEVKGSKLDNQRGRMPKMPVVNRRPVKLLDMAK